MSSSGFQNTWDAYIRKHYNYYAQTPAHQLPDYQQRILALMVAFNWSARAGFELGDKHKALISAVAARPLLHLDLQHYESIKSVCIYPTHSDLARLSQVSGLAYINRFGEIHLAWDAAMNGLQKENDGHCTISHEFIHGIDLRDGRFDGIPEIENQLLYGEWIKVLFRQFANFKHVTKDWHRYFDKEHTSNMYEFFATMSEVFFEVPSFLKKEQPDLYDIFCSFYRQDPMREKAERSSRKE